MVESKLQLPASVLLMGLFALCHGHAHGTELPTAASGLAYSAGFLTSTTVVLLCGIAVGRMARQTDVRGLVRWSGAAIVLCGLWLASAMAV